MKNKITSRDYELISSYLDNQLGSKERAYFESRLKAIPELRNELHEISRTRSMLRSMPKLRAPHNYFINIKTASIPMGVRPALRLVPAMGIVSAAATILLVLVIFGNNLFAPITPVALAPAADAPSIEALPFEQEVQRNAEEVSPSTEAPPMAMMQAPATASLEPMTSALKLGEPTDATPTTIYLFAYPPTATPENEVLLFGEHTEATRISCEEYINNRGGYPTLSYLADCPPSTSTPPGYLQVIQPTITPIPSTTSIYSPTPTPADSATPSQTETPSPTPTPTPTYYPTDTPPVILDEAPSSAAGISPKSPLGMETDSGNPTPEKEAPVQESEKSPNIGFLQYVILAVEIGLATIAIGAGLAAIIIRLRAGR